MVQVFEVDTDIDLWLLRFVAISEANDLDVAKRTSVFPAYLSERILKSYSKSGTQNVPPGEKHSTQSCLGSELRVVDNLGIDRLSSKANILLAPITRPEQTSRVNLFEQICPKNILEHASNYHEGHGDHKKPPSHNLKEPQNAAIGSIMKRLDDIEFLINSQNNISTKLTGCIKCGGNGHEAKDC
ncbi:hypothetical protein RF11_05864 [Thelohanellus kitauei]|uniref:CCHC-type domain-containing protein n=1 Tax=Thelohanellus kitauei TaxID=669202 RepID=A0A0C2MHK5_THEKT|nr:hypothetical protein RF11_05864 [Thelohanellus kitauei]